MNENFSMMFELEDIKSVEEIGLVNMIDISVQGDETFHLSNGLISHNSASGGLMSSLGRKEIGYYELKGRPLNAYDKTAQAFRANKELSELYGILKSEGGSPKPAGSVFYNINLGDENSTVNINDEILIDGIWVPVEEIINDFKELDGF